MIGIGFFTLGDGVGMVGVFVGTTSICLGVGIRRDLGSTLGDIAWAGLSVALFKIWESCMKALVVLDPYSNVGMLRLGSCRIASRSVAAWRR